MTTATLPLDRTAAAARPAGRTARYLRDTALLVGRGLRTLPRVPMRLSDVTIQPVVFTVLFLYVLGSAISVPGMRYQDYLLPGLVGQSVAFGLVGAGVATATDLRAGVVERFRSLPISRLAVITAQVVGQVLEQILGIVLIAALGLAMGWRPHLTVPGALTLAGVLLLGLLAFNWLGVLFGMLLGSPEAVQGVGFAVVFPLIFLAGTYVPIEGMAAVPRAVGQWEPFSAFVAAVRQLTQGTRATGSWPLEHPVAAVVAWSALILVVCVPLAVRRFREALPAA